MSQQHGGAPQGHTRNKSVTKSSRPRSSTKGPLDLADTPLNDPLSSPSRLEPLQPKRASSQRPPGHPSLSFRSPAPSPAPPAVRASMTKNFSFLLRPEIYQPLLPLNVPVAFRNSTKQPRPDAPLAELLSQGHFRAAAISAVQELTSASPRAAPIDPTDHRRIFDLLYTRLACLTLCDATSTAAQEVRALEDLNNAAIYVDDDTGEHLVPWALRVLNVRLQALGFGDPRRAVMSYHDLAREARDQGARAAARHDAAARALWRGRLHDLGIQVAGALVEMEDLAGAAHHLGTLRDGGDGRMALTRALLWLHLGDVAAARRCVRGAHRGEGRHAEQVILALCEMADGEYEAALRLWQALRQEVDDEMVGVNMAVCLLYTGNMDKGREVLESMAGSGRSSHTLLFNLSTMYELCTERNRAMKIKLTERLAGLDATESGWEKTNADFKL
ncbi:hypothetical protein VD0004_g4205 [Verticillium dahliae]|uniref:Trafficking protein particle complex subunit 12 n=1 Tax=Verticillium dahliae TaxID=27337 RepID=A0A444RTQ0_VERDA|nr:hypothetical protein VD0004_g4205 [Verticillium dahliae]RXG44527.1 hypothetical protein VDGE_03429 [Verticillium dahliae]